MTLTFDLRTPEYIQLHKRPSSKILIASYNLPTGQIWEKSDEKWQRNRRTQLVGKKKNKKK